MQKKDACPNVEATGGYATIGGVTCDRGVAISGEKGCLYFVNDDGDDDGLETVQRDWC